MASGSACFRLRLAVGLLEAEAFNACSTRICALFNYDADRSCV